MNLTPDNLRNIFVAFDLRFQAGISSAESFYPDVATVVPSTTRSNTYAWMDKVPKLREWIGDRQIANAAARSYTLQNKTFELTLELDREDVEDDQIGVYNPTVDMMGQQAATYPDDLLADLMRLGQTTIAHDGQFFFDIDHPVNFDDPSSPIQSNFFTGTPLTAANFNSVRAAMLGWKGADGKSLLVRPNLLVVPPALENIARVITESENISVAGGSTQTNVYRGVAKVLVIPQLAGGIGDTEWYLLDTTKPLKPFVFQNRRDPEFALLTDLSDENVFQRNKFVYGVNARGNAGYGLWFLAAKARA